MSEGDITGMWNIIGEPVGRWIEPDDEEGEDRNESHMAIMLVRGGNRQVISRVGFIRRHTKNPDVKFEVQIQHEVDKARKARDAMAELLGDTAALR